MTAASPVSAPAPAPANLPPVQMPPARSARSAWKTPGFLIAAGILAVSALGLNAAVNALQLNFKKAPVPLAMPLSSIPSRLGDWLMVSKDEPLDKEMQDALNTQEYVFRDYVNTKLVTADELASFDGKSALERKQLLSNIQMQKPDAVINMAVTYYTGLVDTVAHIPDRCMVADGYQPSEYEKPDWDLGERHLGNDPTGPITVRFINFEDQTAAGRVTRRVAYFFLADGQYTNDPIGVRKTLSTLRYKHGFYSKVELMTILKDHDQAQTVMKSFLAAALPSIERCMPDWDVAEHGK